MSKSDRIYALDGHDFREMVKAGLTWLRHYQAEINALNVFPVPDGDSGTNMTLTMMSAWKEIADLHEENIGRVAGKVAHGALMGARGNSGVILSQIWRGFARSLDNKTQMRAADLVDAMQEASETAYKGVVKPVEGTMLTVVREVAEEVAVVAQETGDMLEIFERLVEQAKVTEARTPLLLPVLRRAGVVDSGGQGVVVIFEGMWRCLVGLPLDVPEDVALPSLDYSPTLVEFEQQVEQLDAHSEEFNLDKYRYDVQFIISGQGMDVDHIRAEITAMGDSALVIGDPDAIKVHVHVLDPGMPISYGSQCGSVGDVVVEDMLAQSEEFFAVRDNGAAAASAEYPLELGLWDGEELAIDVVVVASGDGLGKVFRSLGASVIVPGGQTMNPSTAQLLEAIEQVSSNQVVVLPNNKNVLMAALQAAEVSSKDVAVVPTKTVPQGISALLTLDQQAELMDNVAAMSESATEVTTAEVTWATRDVALNGLDVREGDAIGLLEGELVVDTGSLEEAVRWLLAEADLEGCELVTLYYGEGVTEELTNALVETLAKAYPDLEFEVVEGGQPHYPYIISIE